jgi:transposase
VRLRVKPAKALRENINYMWLSGYTKPNFRMINRFRGVVMREVIEKVFTAVLDQLIGHGYVRLENCFIDGTTIEENANRYSFLYGGRARKTTGRSCKQKYVR